jgi:membrane glycosyltransferase
MNHQSNGLFVRMNPGWRRLRFSALVLVVFGLQVLLFADLLWRTSFYGLKYPLLAVYAILALGLSFGFSTALVGFCVRLIGSRKGDITRSLPEWVPGTRLPATALLFPIYNEDPARTFAGVRATLEEVERAGILPDVDLFVLSDSRDPEKWAAEELLFADLCRERKCVGKVIYRHRARNVDKKSGNIADFLERWGASYRYMVIFDADSVMTGEAVRSLILMMEANPNAGVIQTVPAVVRGESVHGRVMQFAAGFYARVFTAGLNFWQQDEGNYWGHNAIIRVRPFIEHCVLPVLPWREPLGGKILSHDFVEAALFRKAGYEVWLAYDLPGSFEEAPPSLVEAAQRDKRWCQGNLQHAWLLFARGFHPVSRLHFFIGIMSYAGSFLWFWFLLLSTLLVVQFSRSDLTFISTGGLTSRWDVSLTQHALVLSVITAVLLFSPKLFALADAVLHQRRRRRFGGLRRLVPGVLAETAYSFFMAPVNMLWHTLFMVVIPLGAGVSWGNQRRSAEGGLSWRSAWEAHKWHVGCGALWSAVAWWFDPGFAAWLLFITVPMLISAPFSVFGASPELGGRLRALGLWSTPEELDPPQALKDVAHWEETYRGRLPAGSAVEAVVRNPAALAVHLALLNPPTSSGVGGLVVPQVVRPPFKPRPPGHVRFADLSEQERLEILRSPEELRAWHVHFWELG